MITTKLQLTAVLIMLGQLIGCSDILLHGTEEDREWYCYHSCHEDFMCDCEPDIEDEDECLEFAEERCEELGIEFDGNYEYIEDTGCPGEDAPGFCDYGGGD